MRFAKKILFKTTKPFPANNYLGSSYTLHTGQLSNLPLLFLLLLKHLEQQAIFEH